MISGKSTHEEIDSYVPDGFTSTEMREAVSIATYFFSQAFKLIPRSSSTPVEDISGPAATLSMAMVIALFNGGKPLQKGTKPKDVGGEE